MRLDRKELLDEIGFVWKVKVGEQNNDERWIKDEKRWHQQYEKLVDFQRKNGHCRVPTKYKDKTFAMWVGTQKGIHIDNKTRQDRNDLLDEIGLVRRDTSTHSLTVDKKWKLQYEKLVAFKRQHEHCVVPNVYEQDRCLGRWVAYQRKLYHINKLRLDRKGLLVELEFVWNVDPHEWNLKYKKLVEFQQNNGHCIVPFMYEQDKYLGQ